MTGVHTATVFDLDDTLIDTAGAWPRACAAFSARHGYRWRPEDTAALHGNGNWAAHVAAVCGGRATTAEVVDACTDIILDEHAAHPVRPLPGALDLVAAAERHGPVAVATASPRRFVLTVLDALRLTTRMSAVICGEDVGRAKPAPDPYLRAAARIGLPPSACLAVEDSPAGIRSAAAAGIRVLAIPRHGMRLPAGIAHLPAAQARSAVEALPLLTRLHTSRPELLAHRTTAQGR
ncbi:MULTISPECIES: HAD family phosphatase [unclassified Streptomyces]|uniref:HAD family hydrolase n=1 Tax=unclassified Streptomyces TaxID=2593676 RepID=UPI00093D00AC|nr:MULTISPECIES: HAD family phosphatase [unclassified Streptomyces]ROP55734.1 HAD superfamily hydrolase (TIGR01509 family) [Streptomyces sp. PanSC9]